MPVKTTKKPESKSTKLKTDSQKKKSEQFSVYEAKNARVKRVVDESSIYYQITPYILSFLGIFLLVCLVFPSKMNLLGTLAKYLCGVFSFGAWAIPFLFLINAIYWKIDVIKNRVKVKTVLSVITLAFISVCAHLVSGAENTYNIKLLFQSGIELKSGGIVGGYLGSFLSLIGGTLGAGIISAVVLLIVGFALFNLTPIDAILYIKNKISIALYDKRELKKRISKPMVQNTDEQSLSDNPKSVADIENNEVRRKTFNADISIDEVRQEKDGKEIKLESINLNNNVKKGIASIFDMSKKERKFEDPIDQKPQNNEKDISVAINDEEKSETTETKEFNLKDIFTEGAVISAVGMEIQPEVLADGKIIISEKKLEEIEVENSINEVAEVKIDAISSAVPIDAKPTLEEMYCFPDFAFLKKDPNPGNFEVTDELKNTSIKLVETLTSFNVRTKIMNISCGPTVTRYELQPEVGIRVRSIQNLSDDIALHLAAPGIRIEAPIPGKDAVGIEIPNKNVSTVYIRNLIESKAFAEQKSRLSVCLGMDVAGSSIFMDIAKMPHLLIAGATGMGKSVCINSFIVSILYKARPDEVKLILIDPKKVELSIYNGIPHLLVPVVSDPKKAAGSLSWAVNEMERRFMLIEEVGVRDIKTYNEVTKDDPEKEFMPQVVIIIDELADLMMTARDDVESSICRLAQKARAAGMHLVIGTQRPSVDVITGLIKANVPSRIAFTVASQVDSRTIIDISGAEKLVGRGDMLFAPVGCMKPVRVQGAFVSEKEVEQITDYLKAQSKAEYDSNIIESIEREAANCGEKKKNKLGSGESEDGDAISDLESDEMIIPAIGIAIDCGQVSTSLLQRRLSLGYARAGRIIDKLEKMKIISPFEGSKPRKILITYEEYMELKMRIEGKSDE